MTMRAVKIIDVICIALFVFMGVFIFALPDATQNVLMPVFTIINPYKTGAWIMGIGFLVTCLWGKGKSGLIFGNRSSGMLHDYSICISGWIDGDNKRI